VVKIANQKAIGKQEQPPAFSTPSGGMIRFRFEGFLSARRKISAFRSESSPVVEADSMSRHHLSRMRTAGGSGLLGFFPALCVEMFYRVEKNTPPLHFGITHPQSCG
jgi:hypothetical protein